MNLTLSVVHIPGSDRVVVITGIFVTPAMMSGGVHDCRLTLHSWNFQGTKAIYF